MNKRGPKPFDKQELLDWQQRWYFLFQRMRDGIQYEREHHEWSDDLGRNPPEPLSPLMRKYPREIHSKLGLSPEEIHTEHQRRVTARINRALANFKVVTTVIRDGEPNLWRALTEPSKTAAQIRRIYRRSKWLNPPQLKVNKKTAVERFNAFEGHCPSCDPRHERSPYSSPTTLSRHIEQKHPSQPSSSFHRHLCDFAEMLLPAFSYRYPASRRNTSDHKRMLHLAAAMAGISTGKSPIVAIDALRKIRHPKNCACWKCALNK
jgi:hypothetical protein